MAGFPWHRQLAPPHDLAAKQDWMPPVKSLLDGGEIEPLVARLREIAAEQTGLVEEILKEADFFATNASRMNYPGVRSKGLLTAG